MTIICVKDGVIAADGACWYGGVKAELSKLKIVRSHDGALGGSVGDASYTEFFRRVVRRDERARGARPLPAER